MHHGDRPVRRPFAPRDDIAGPGPGGARDGSRGHDGPDVGGHPGDGGWPGQPRDDPPAPSVQKELKLSDEQKGKAYKLAQMANQKGRELIQSMAVARGSVNPRMMMEAGLRLRQETDQAASKILDPKQKERLDQIALRVEGPLAVARPEVAAKLRLNPTQNEYVQGIVMQMRQQLFMGISQGAASGQFDPGQVRMLATRLREGAVGEIGKVLDRKQKNAFNKLLGEPFDISKIESESASAVPAAAPPADASSKTGDAPRAKDDPAAGKEDEESTRPPAREKDRSGAGSNRWIGSEPGDSSSENGQGPRRFRRGASPGFEARPPRFSGDPGACGAGGGSRGRARPG